MEAEEEEVGETRRRRKEGISKTGKGVKSTKRAHKTTARITFSMAYEGTLEKPWSVLISLSRFVAYAQVLRQSDSLQALMQSKLSGIPTQCFWLSLKKRSPFNQGSERLRHEIVMEVGILSLFEQVATNFACSVPTG